ncbi:hypothetical protein BN903_70 [Halorubrum sp. AJ67]|nr:hypothetical protein BN903_70 [Halorubrum sp. AJ67]
MRRSGVKTFRRTTYIHILYVIRSVILQYRRHLEKNILDTTWYVISTFRPAAGQFRSKPS